MKHKLLFFFSALLLAGSVLYQTQARLYNPPTNITTLTVGTSTTPFLATSGKGFVGVATSTPASLLSIDGPATTTVMVGSSATGLNSGACLALKDKDGVGTTYVTVNNGVLTASIVSCK